MIADESSKLKSKFEKDDHVGTAGLRYNPNRSYKPHELYTVKEFNRNDASYRNINFPVIYDEPLLRK